MTFSYSASEATGLDQVRGIIGDTTDAGHFLENETISAILTANGDAVGPSAVECVRRIIAKIAKETDRSHPDGISVSRTQKSQQYRDLLRELEGLYGKGGSIEMFVGGSSKAENEAFETSPDFVQPSFRRGMWGGS